LKRIFQYLIYADGVTLLEKTETLLNASKHVALEVKAEKNKYILRLLTRKKKNP
jgi:hypothetical protein